MEFQLDFNIEPFQFPFNHQQKIMMVGSCFAENIGLELKNNKFNVLENPNGILYNPISISECLINCIENKQYTKEDLFQLNDVWYSWQHHSRYSDVNVEKAISKINESTTQAHKYLKTAEVLIITLGTSFVSVLTDIAITNQKGIVAANNHKAPLNWFERRMLKPEQIVMVLGTMLDKLGNFNSNIKVIFTVSPVRHIKEGLVENNRSKAVLIQALQVLFEKLEKLYYFPAYELVIDVLRDYRFFADDLLHPSKQAIEFVFDKFIKACTKIDTQNLMKEIQKINTAYHHKPFHPDTNQHGEFLKDQLKQVQFLQKKYSYLNFKDEIKYFNS